MQMHFVFSDNVTLLFEFWTVQTLAGLILSFVVVLFLTIIYELSKVWKSNLLSRVLQTLPLTPDSDFCPPLISDSEANLPAASDSLIPPDPSSSGEDSVPPVQFSTSSNCRWWLLHSSVALLHSAQVSLGYLLMLCVMSYNATIFIAVVLGSGLGYYVAFPLLAKYPKPHIL
ncbi:probable low affinity copper uptake protein 2 [Bufo gargarizans]|uniref:probable low affinity copper uptake protein 2 n=1 Tax=Bufo gargarizans TaxID=30331 RepID=UPI001CF19FE1|nr:probable low affinity copper uptake protein 2 [Bufo gargarizans]